MPPALVRRHRAVLAQQRVDAFHCLAEVLGRPGPARRIDAGLATKLIDTYS